MTITNKSNKRIALLLKGAVSITGGVIRGFVKDENKYVNYPIIKNSIVEHIIKPNDDCDFDFFIHCWNTDLQNELCNLYDPVKYTFEKNEPLLKPYEEYGDHAIRQISQAFAIQRGIELIESTNIHYDQVIIYRPDILLWKNMDLKKYDQSKIYVNAHQDHGGSGGDFHFVMNLENASNFKNLVKSVKENPPRVHRWIKNYVKNFMKKELVMDEIIPPNHQEVLRKIIKTKGFYFDKYITESDLNKMNIKMKDLY